MECTDIKKDKRTRRRKISFTEALKEKYCEEDDPALDFIIVSPKRKGNSSAELAHLQTVVLNGMDISRADIPRQGLVSLCPNVVDLDLANNLLDTWSELISILSHLPKVRYLNVSRNRLRLDLTNAGGSITSVENLALNDTGITIEEVVRLSQIMPAIKELHLCENNYEDLAEIEHYISGGAFSCLECLRLNNNEIIRWSEIWKLRSLPLLKCLVLSGNPIDGVFYHHDKRVNENAQSNLETLQDPDPGSVELHPEVKQDCVFSGVNVSFNNDRSHILIDKFYQDGSDQQSAKFTCENVEDSLIHCKHFDLIEERSSAEARNRSEDVRVKVSVDHNVSGVKHRSEVSAREQCDRASTNTNNSCRGAFHKSLYDACNNSIADGNLINEDVFDSNSSDSGNDNDTENWQRDLAEEFLNDILDGINFDDINDQVVPKLQPSDFDPSSNLLDAECGLNLQHFSKMELVGRSEQTATSQHGTAQNTSQQELGLNMFYGSLYTGLDPQFVPRAISMLDDDLMNPYFYMVTPSPPRSRGVQRCLFQEAIGDSHEETGQREDCRSISWDDAGSKVNCQFNSDDCFDCETEQDTQKPHQSANCTATEKFVVSDKLKPATLRSPVMLSQPKKVSGRADYKPSQSAILSPPQLPSSQSSSQPSSQSSSQPSSQPIAPIPLCQLCGTGQELESNNNKNSNNNNNISDQCCPHSRPPGSSGQSPSCDSLTRRLPFQHLQVLCLSSASLSHWSHLQAFSAFPELNNLRLKNNPLYSNINPDDRRKLYIASLPRVTILNGSEVSQTEREKAERHFLQYFMDQEERPDIYHLLVDKHGPPVKLVDIDLSAGYQEWANLTFVCKGVAKFSRKIHLVEPVGRLRAVISQVIGLPKNCFTMYHHSCGPSHPESEQGLVELRCESLPMSRFDFSDGDEIHINVGD